MDAANTLCISIERPTTTTVATAVINYEVSGNSCPATVSGGPTSTVDPVPNSLNLYSIGNLVWDDINEDGLKDVGEPGLEGVEISFTGAGISGSTFTNANGNYNLPALLSNNYTLTVVPPASHPFVTLQGVGSNNMIDSDFDQGTKQVSVTLLANDETIDCGLSTSTVVASSPEINVQGLGMNILDNDMSPMVGDNTDFGNVLTSGSDVHTFTIENTGTADLTVSTIVVSGTNPTDFTLGGITLPATVSASGSTTFTLTFIPGGLGSRTATVTVNNNDADEAAYDFAVQGTGVAPEINVQGQSMSILNGDATPSTADDTDFGDLLVMGSDMHTFTIENTGTGDLNILGILLNSTPHFSISGITTPLTIASGGSTTFNVTFNPQSAGLQVASITINNTDSDESQYVFVVQGTGGLPGAALDFDGTNDYVAIANAPENNFSSTNLFTIDFWCKVNANSGTFAFVNKGGGGGNEQYSFDIFNSSFRFYVNSGSSFTVLSMPRLTVAEGWVHIAGTYNGSSGEMNLYKNGVLAANTSSAVSTLKTTTNPFAFGAQASPLNQYLNGQLDEVRIWNRELCLAEIVAQKDCELTGTEAGLVGYYQFNQGIAAGSNAGETTLNDLTSNNNGTLTNFALTGATSNWVAPGAVTTGTSCAAYPIVGISTADVCTSFSNTITAGAGWTTINDGSGNPIIAINAPVGVDLGTVTVELMRNSAIQAFSNFDGVVLKLLPRYYHISSSLIGENTPFPSNVGVRFYFTESDLAAMNASALGDVGVSTFTAADLDFTHYSGPDQDCNYANNIKNPANNELIASTTYSAFGCYGHSLEFNVSHFSEFIPHEPAGAALPIELVDFTAKLLANETVQLDWQTATEINNMGFEVQRSKNARDWESLGFVEGAGNSEELLTYSFVDAKPNIGFNYYRLQQFDFDGTTSFSTVEVVKLQSDWEIYPNPTKDGLVNLDFSTSQNEPIQISVYDIKGAEVYRKDIDITAGDQSINLDMGSIHVSGIYIVKIIHGTEMIYKRLMIE